jgi:hypothetical protein
MAAAGRPLQLTTQVGVCIVLQCLLGWLVDRSAAAVVVDQLLSCACAQYVTAHGTG